MVAPAARARALPEDAYPSALLTGSLAISGPYSRYCPSRPPRQFATSRSVRSWWSVRCADEDYRISKLS